MTKQHGTKSRCWTRLPFRLSEAELAEVTLFGERRSFTKDEALFCAGDYRSTVTLFSSEGFASWNLSTGERVVFVRYGPGYFTGDIDLFTRRSPVVSCEADTDVEAIRLTPSQLRNMFTRRTSFQRRRELLLVSKFRGLSIYGKKTTKRHWMRFSSYSATAFPTNGWILQSRKIASSSNGSGKTFNRGRFSGWRKRAKFGLQFTLKR